MSTVVGTDTSERASGERWRATLRWTPLLPALPGAVALAAPHWSAAWSIIVGSLLLLCAVLTAVVVNGQRYDSYRWRGAFVIYAFDLLAFFMLVIVVRNLDVPSRVDGVLVAAFVAAAALGHRSRRSILQELLEPRTRLGLAFAAFGSIGAAGAGMLGYATSRALPPVVVFAELYLVALVLVLCSHSLWTKAEDPGWQPDRRVRRRSRAGRPA